MMLVPHRRMKHARSSLQSGQWKRRQTGHGKQKIGRGVAEVQVGVYSCVVAGQKDSSAARVIDGDMSFEPAQSPLV